MFYKQSVDQIKLVILTLDGGLLDLNHLRYNYYRRLCNKYDLTPSLDEFQNDLGNYKTMFAHSPIQDKINNEELINSLETDLFQYAKLKQTILKEGSGELLEFFRHKNIKIAVLSTHKAKRAIQYLQLTKLYNYVDFVIGGDSHHDPLPDPSVLQNICDQMKVDPMDTLVIAPFPSLVNAANQLMMNIIYVPDLQSVTQEIEFSVLHVVRNNLEVINAFLFSKYDNVDMFSPLLGMSKDMDLDTLKECYERLLNVYEKEPGIIQRIHQVYHMYRDRIIQEEMSSETTEIFEDDVVDEEPIMEEETSSEEMNHEENPEIVDEENYEDAYQEVQEDNYEEEQNIVEDQTDEEPTIEESFEEEIEDTVKDYTEVDFGLDKDSLYDGDTVVLNESLDSFLKRLDKEQESEMNHLIASINHEEDESIQENHEEDDEVIDRSKDKLRVILDVILDIFYTLVLSLLTILTGALANMFVQDLLDNGSFQNFINEIVKIYTSMVYYFGLAIFSIIPFHGTYDEFITYSPFSSDITIYLGIILLFNFIVIYIIRGFIYVVKNDE